MRKILLTIIIIFLVLFLSIRLVIFDFNFYKKEFEKNNVYNKLGKENTNDLTVELINYLKEKGELENKIFSEKEKLHLLDVKNLIKKSFSLLYILLVIFILLLGYSFYKKDKKIGNCFILGGLLTILLILIIFLLIKISFDFIFTQFHYLAFSNNLWLLNEKDILINLFPIGFFQDITIKIVAYNFIFASFSVIFGIFLNKILIRK